MTQTRPRRARHPPLYNRPSIRQRSGMLRDRLASDAVLDTAFAWLCQRRANYPANADIWSLRRDWPREKPRIRAALLAGAYRFDTLRRTVLANGDEIDLWSARDALVLKALALTLPGVLPVSRRCTHVKGHGGAKAAVRQVAAHLAANGFVFRTDVKSYYASIDHHALLDRLARHIDDRAILHLLGQYLRRTVDLGGNFHECRRGISLGCPLSPLIGAFYLGDLDDRMARSGLFYVRFMDDIVVLARTRWALRRAVKAVHATLGALGLETHPDKTFVGRTARGFSFLGYAFGSAGLRVAPATVRRFVERTARLYEQEREDHSPLRAYVRRWMGWATGGLRDGTLSGGLPPPAQTRQAHEAHPE